MNINKKDFRFLQVSTDEVFGALKKMTRPLKKKINIILITHIQQVKQAQIILLEHFIKHMVYLQLYLIVLTIMVHISNLKN